MSSLVGMAGKPLGKAIILLNVFIFLLGNAMTQIGVGLGSTKSPTKAPLDKQNNTTRKIDSNTGDDFDDEDPQNLLTQSVINTQNSSNSSEQRRIGGGDDDNSNSFESHSDYDLNHPYDKTARMSNTSNEKNSRQKNRRGMSVNWGNSSTTPINPSSSMANTSRRQRPNRGQTSQKPASNVKFFATSMAHSLYRNPIRLSGLSATLKTKTVNAMTNKTPTHTSSNPTQQTVTVTSIPMEGDVPVNRTFSPPQPRPESLAIMSDELFHERLKARQSPLIIAPSIHPSTVKTTTTSLTVNKQLSNNFPSTSSFLLDKHCIEDVTYSTTNQFTSTNADQTGENEITPTTSPQDEQTDFIEIKSTNLPESPQTKPIEEKIASPIKAFINYSADSSDESWRLLNSNSSLDEHIPYIDETDFEDLGKQKNLHTNHFIHKAKTIRSMKSSFN